MFDVPFVSGLGGGLIVVVSSTLLDEDAKATNRPLASMDGPAWSGGLTPLLACAPSGATSTKAGRPAPVAEGTTEKCKIALEPPPGDGFTTCTVNVPAAATSPLASCALRDEPLNMVGLPVPLMST